MRNRKPHRIVLIAACAIAACVAMLPCDAFADDLDTDATVEPVDWELMITRFAVRPRTNTDVPQPLKFEKLEQLPSIRAAWLAIKPLARIRTDAYGEGDPIVSGWEMTNERNERGFETDTIGAFVHVAKGDKPVQTVLANEEVRIMFACDILMSGDQRRKEQVVNRYFRVLELEVSGPIHISDDPKDVRAAVPADAKPERDWVRRIERRLIDVAWADAMPDKRVPEMGTLVFRAKGVKEFRVRATVSGKLSEFEEPKLQTVEAAIRVVAVAQGIKVDQLNMLRTGQSGTGKSPDSGR